jgi:hypothetical protein
MNEILPPSEPGKEPSELPPPAPVTVTQPSQPLSKKACAGLGFLIFIVSAGLSLVIPPTCLFGLALAIASLFIKGYRFIFVGYILSIGLLLLGMIIYCSQYPPNFH